MTTVEQLSEPIIADVSGWVKGLLGEAQADPSGSVEEWIGRVREEGAARLRTIAETVVRAKATYEPAPSCEACGQAMRSKGFEERRLGSRLGRLTLSVRRWRCPTCKEAERPLLSQVEVRHGLLPEVWRQAVRYGVGLPYRQAERLFDDLGCPVSDNVVRLVVGELGQAEVERRREEAAAVERLEVTIPAERRPERLYLLADGYKVRMRDQAQPWREARVALFFETAAKGLDAKGRPPQARWVKALSSVVREPDDEAQADSFFRLVWPAGLRCGAAYAEEMVLLSDGADALWRRLPEQVPLGVRKTEILDFYHAAQNVAKGARAAAGEAAGNALFRPWRQWLLAGQAEAVRAELAARVDGAVDPKAVQEVIGYLDTHRTRMRYLSLRAQGYHIGSGAVESWCKRLLGRVRGPGMRWSEDGLEAVLALGCQFAEEDWNELPRAA